MFDELSHPLKIYQDFKDLLDGFLHGDISEKDILKALDALNKKFVNFFDSLQFCYEAGEEFLEENKSWMTKMDEACQLLEESRDLIEESILVQDHDIEEYMAMLKKANQLLIDVHIELEDLNERETLKGYI